VPEETSLNVDLVVIGMGPGGEFVADGLLKRGMCVVAIESQLIGGECAMWGCVPTKMMVRAANLLAEARRVNGVAGTTDIETDWSLVARRIREEATSWWDDTTRVDSFERQGGTFIRGVAEVVVLDAASLDRWENEAVVIGSDQHPTGPKFSVVVGDTRYTPRVGIVIAVGAHPSAPDIPGLADVPYWTNRDVVQLAELPRSLAILGGGAIAVELGQVLSRFGVDVTIIEVADRLLASEEPEASSLIEGVLRRDGVTVVTGTKVLSVAYDDRSFDLDLGSDGHILADRLLVATGRRPLMADLGWAAMGVDPAATSVATDEYMRVAPGIWAVGDITDRGAFTHVATYQAEIAVADIAGEPTHGADYRAVPRVTYTDPEIGSVGLSEQTARESGLSVRVGVASIPEEARGWIHKVGNEGMIKLIEDRDRGVLVGALSIGPCGGEVLALLTLAVHAEVPLTTLRSMFFAYPTFHRALGAALRDLEVG
jgi:pyruvate/2-oxoglutarate dehydrogenase complex dihydrolipoamide dehydrogenase (E3) component